jgi:hypothetical protein
VRYRARFLPALVNAAAQIAPICGALLLLVLSYGLLKGMPIEPRDWNLLIGAFGGTLVLTSLAMCVSELFDGYEVDASGVTYRGPAGIGVARLVMKKTASVAWREIVAARPFRAFGPFRWTPYPGLELRIERADAEGAARHESLSLPLYVHDRERLLRDLTLYVPAGHPLRAALDEAAG